MKTINNKGFSSLFIVLIIVLIVAITGIGYYIFRSQNKSTNNGSPSTQQQPNPTQQEDETSNWKTVESIGGEFSIKVPDGWELFNYPGNTLNGNSITYTAGKPAVIHTESQAYASSQKKFNVGFSDNTNSSGPQWQSPNQYGIETTSDYFLGEIEGKKYSIEWKESVTGVTKGDKIYQYAFNLANGKQIGIVYMQAPTDTDNLKLIEQVIQTIVIK